MTPLNSDPFPPSKAVIKPYLSKNAMLMLLVSPSSLLNNSLPHKAVIPIASRIVVRRILTLLLAGIGS